MAVIACAITLVTAEGRPRKFGGGDEDEMLRRADADFVHVSITGSRFVSVLAGHVESPDRLQEPAVGALVEGDPRTTALFEHYSSLVASLSEP